MYQSMKKLSVLGLGGLFITGCASRNRISEDSDKIEVPASIQPTSSPTTDLRRESLKQEIKKDSSQQAEKAYRELWK